MRRVGGHTAPPSGSCTNEPVTPGSTQSAPRQLCPVDAPRCVFGRRGAMRRRGRDRVDGLSRSRNLTNGSRAGQQELPRRRRVYGRRAPKAEWVPTGADTGATRACVACGPIRLTLKSGGYGHRTADGDRGRIKGRHSGPRVRELMRKQLTPGRPSCKGRKHGRVRQHRYAFRGKSGRFLLFYRRLLLISGSRQHGPWIESTTPGNDGRRR